MCHCNHMHNLSFSLATNVRSFVCIIAHMNKCSACCRNAILLGIFFINPFSDNRTWQFYHKNISVSLGPNCIRVVSASRYANKDETTIIRHILLKISFVRRYLKDPRSKHFSASRFVKTHWHIAMISLHAMNFDF